MSTPADPAAGRRRSGAGAVAILAGLALGVGGIAGCGNEDGSSPADSLLDKVGQARDVQAESAVRIAVTTASIVRADQGSFPAAAQLAQALAARDSTARYTTSATTGAGTVQVMGGGGQPVMFVARSQSGNYVAAWLDASGVPRFYTGTSAPAYTATAPSGGGWR